jgi:hypothetical protein
MGATEKNLENMTIIFMNFIIAGLYGSNWEKSREHNNYYFYKFYNSWARHSVITLSWFFHLLCQNLLHKEGRNSHVSHQRRIWKGCNYGCCHQLVYVYSRYGKSGRNVNVEKKLTS